jgi:hypothetical protein
VTSFQRPPLEPPVSPPFLGVVGTPPTPAPDATVEARLLRAKIVTPDQMSEAMRLEAEHGTPVAETVAARGWATKAQLEEVLGPPSADEPEHQGPELVPVPEPADEPDAPELPPAAAVRVMVRLRNGEQLEVAALADAEEARARAQALVEQLGDADSWPFVAGEALDAADVEAIFLLHE